MKTMPTAEYVLKTKLVKYINAGKLTEQDRVDAINDAMIEFAKLHVKSALKTASKIQSIDGFYTEYDSNDELIFDYNNNYESTYKAPLLCRGKAYIINKESILNAYPEDLIK